MAFAQGSTSRLSYVTEVTYGTDPATTHTVLPYETHSLNLSKERVQGNDITEDRMSRIDRHGNRSVAGDITTSLRADEYDDLFESLMFSTWDTTPVTAPDVLKVGTTLKSFTIEDWTGQAVDQARKFTGMAVSSASFSIAPNQLVQTTWSFVGKDMTISATQEAAPTASAGLQPFDSYSGAITLDNQGVAEGSLAAINSVTSLEFTVNNSLAPTFVVGSDTTPQLEYGRCEVEGTLTAYFEDASLINRFLNEDDTAMKLTVDDPTAANEYGFYFPFIKVNGADVSIDSEQSRLITIPFVALYDSTAGSNLVISRPETA
jgi:hypothetical protein